ncbi:hypothetical protein, conserved [Trypanosoma brucei brucei TREU927]|uniref:Uncharacterized protein n=1 Tax=Trypanosoma brucei brucei (strain 927/4 GUTat10.1) TaxID=185431 RepID=Q585R2_TRYB2|nr:hypothetical protein, conserved [Trypanosoma brucei brucei TREU927]AAX79691.1 hypothetical protein, conserved [Trypanosoma brucei]AAZ11711.1 hypothetical protein, conserved [Trypanosoma brucei brucei TREU927]
MFASQSISLYKECCQFYNVKPNTEILQQVDTPQLMLEEIDASRTLLGELGVKALLDCISCHVGIRRVVLKKNGLSTTCVEHLCRFLRGSRYVCHVDVSENPMNVAAARVLWETARIVPTLTEINVEKCELEDEWPRRLERCCKSNEETQAAVIAPCAEDLNPMQWDVVFVAVAGPASYVEKYSTEILPPVSSLLAQYRLRVCLLAIDENDTPDVAVAKIERCAERYNHGLSWCVALVDDAVPWNEAALKAVMATVQQTRPITKPLKDKFGAICSPAIKCVTNFFVYDVTLLSESDEKGEEKPDTAGVVEVPPEKWFPAVNWDEVGDCDVPSAVRLRTKNCWKVRCQSDLYCALTDVFSRKFTMEEGSQNEEKEVDEEKAYILTSEKESLFSSYPMCKEIVLHVEKRLWSTCVPIVLIGTDVKAHNNVLSWLANKYAESGPMKVVFYPYKRDNRSMVVFLSYLLGVLSKSPMELYLSLDTLCNEVHDAISHYEDEPLLMIIPSMDTLDSCGNDYCCSLDWLPSTLPPKITLVVSIKTESPILVAFRKRLPQPFEVLNAPLPDEVRSWLFTEELVRRGILGGTAGGHQEDGGDTSNCEAWKRVVGNAFLNKDGSKFTSFDTYAASLLFRFSLTTDSEDVTFFLPSEVPNTMRELLVKLLKVHEDQGDPLTVRYVLTCLAAASLPVTEVVCVCEDLGPCPRNKTIPVLLMLIDDGIVEIHGGSVAHLAGPEVHEVVNSLYSDLLDNVNALVENHLYRLVKTRSPDLSLCFRQIGPLIFVNGSFENAYSLILDASIMDAAFSREKSNTQYAIDIIFRLLNSYRLLSQLHDGEYFVFDKQDQSQRRSALLNAAKDIQSFDCFFFQSALQLSEVSPYYRDASTSEEVPYSVLAPLNTAGEEGSSISIPVNETPIYVHLREKYLVISTKTTVFVYSTGNFDKVVATFDTTCNKDAVFQGALSACGTRIVLIWDRHLATFDFLTGGHSNVDDVTATLSDRALDVLGTNIAVQHNLSKSLSIMDLTKKNKVIILPTLEAEAREAYFFGSSVLATSLYDLFIIRGCRVQKLSHTGVIRCVAFPASDRLIASSVDEDIWIWSGAGELLHIANAGRTPIEELYLNSNGGQLLSRQQEGLKLWETSSGRFKKLDQLFDEIPTQLLITGSDSFIIALCGYYLYVWDASTRRPVGVLTCAIGAITFVQERNQLVMALTSRNEVKVWRLGDNPFLSTKVLQKKSLSSNWRLSGKLSAVSIERITANSKGTLFAALDSDGALLLQPTKGGPPTVCAVKEVEGMVFLCNYLVFSFKEKAGCFCYIDLDEEEFKVSEMLLPTDAREKASLDFVADPDDRYLAVVSNFDKGSTLYVYEVSTWSLLNQFIGHSGHVFYGFFVEDVLISVCKDLTVRCWSLQNHAERTSYKHPFQIAAAARDTESPVVSLFFFDVYFHLFHLHVDGVDSSARFEVQKVSTLPPPATLKPVQCVYVSGLVVVVAGCGSVFLVNVRRGGAATKLSNYKCLCVATYKNGPESFVLTGHTTGEVLLNGVRHGP